MTVSSWKYGLTIENIQYIIKDFKRKNRPLFRIKDKPKQGYLENLYKDAGICSVMMDNVKFTDRLKEFFNMNIGLSKCKELTKGPLLFFFFGGYFRFAEKPYEAVSHLCKGHLYREVAEKNDFINDLLKWKFVPSIGETTQEIKWTIVDIEKDEIPDNSVTLTEYIIQMNMKIISDYCTPDAKKGLRELLLAFAAGCYSAEQTVPVGTTRMELGIVEEFGKMLYLLSELAETSMNKRTQTRYLAQGFTWLLIASILRDMFPADWGEFNNTLTDIHNDADKLGIVIPEVYKKTNLRNDNPAKIPEEQDNNKAVSYELTDIPPAVDLTGREDDIHAVKELLRDKFIVCIHANGGVGKTALALRVINDIKADVLSEKTRHEHVAWITCTGNLKDDLGKLEEIPAVKSAQTVGQKYKEAYHYLKNNNVFLVLDNMDNIPNAKELTQLNTLAGKTTILITTRAEIPVFARYDLNNLEQNKALQLFYTHYLHKRGTNDLTNKAVQVMDDYEYAQKIVQASSYNTLFIELIGKMAYLDHWKLDKLQKKLEEGGIFSQDSKNIIPTAHGTDRKLLAQIRELYLMSRLTDRQKEIMRFLALFPAEHSIFFDVFKWAGFFDDEEENFGELQDRGWIERDSEGYFIHTMVRGSIELQDEFGNTDITMYDKLIKELSYTEQYMPITMEYTKVRERMVVPETVCKLLLHSDNYNYSTLYSNLAIICRIQGRFKEASTYFLKALDLREHKLGKDHPDTVIIYNNLSVMYRSEGKYEDALKYCKKALAVHESAFGEKALRTATDYNNLAALYSEQGNYKEALIYYKKALEIRESKLGKEHPDTAMVYNNIAGVYYSQGNYEKAQEILRTVLPIQKKVLGEEHPETVMTYNNLTVLFQAQGEYEEALRYCKEALNIQRKAFGEDHPATASVYNNLANIYNAKGKYEEALEYYKKALLIRKRAYGEDNKATAETYSNMAEVYNAKAQYEDALKYILKSNVYL